MAESSSHGFSTIIAGRTMLSFLAGYTTPKHNDFDEKKLKDADETKSRVNVNPGLEPCALALGSQE